MLAVFLSLTSVAAVAAWLYLPVSPWVIVPIWALLTLWIQYAMHLQRREWKQRYVTSSERRTRASDTGDD